MPYKVSYRSSFKKDLKSFKKNKPAAILVKEKVVEIYDSPSIGSVMSGNLHPMMKFAFGDRPAYRILYHIYDCCPVDVNRPDKCRFEDVEELEEGYDCEGMVEFVFVRTREDCNNLYRQSKKYFEKYLRESKE